MITEEEKNKLKKLLKGFIIQNTPFQKCYELCCKLKPDLSKSDFGDIMDEAYCEIDILNMNIKCLNEF